MDNYKRYKLLDYFMRSEDRIFNMNKKPSNLLVDIIESTFSIELDDSSKMLTSDDMIIVSTKNIVAREYIQYKGNKALLLLLPISLRSDNYSIDNKINTLFKALYDGSSNEKSIYSIQNRLIPLLITTIILGDMYAPFDQLADTIINNTISDKLFALKNGEKDKESIKVMMEYINSTQSDDTFKNNILNNSGIFTIIDKELAMNIVNSYII